MTDDFSYANVSKTSHEKSIRQCNFIRDPPRLNSEVAIKGVKQFARLFYSRCELPTKFPQYLVSPH